MKRRRGGGILALIFGTIIGAITAIFLGTDEKGQTKKKVKEGVSKTKKKVKEIDKKDVIEAVEKQINKSSKEFKKAKEKLVKKLDMAKKKFDTIDKKKYQKLVSEVTEELKKTGKTTGAQLKQIKALLVSDYKKVAPKKKAKKAKKK